jgi:hypothetical protein
MNQFGNYIRLENIQNTNLEGRDPMTAFFINEEKGLYLDQLEELKENQENFNYRVFFAKDFPIIENANSYSYLPVYQEGYAEDTIENGRALITWGVNPCVVIAAFNPLEGIYMTHALDVNHFSKDTKSTAWNSDLSRRQKNITCRGKVINESFPSWIENDHTQLYLFSNVPITLLNRIKQFRRHGYNAPIHAYLGTSWDGRYGRILGIKRTPSNNNLITNTRGTSHLTTIAITSDGVFGIPYIDSRAENVPRYIKLYMNEFEKNIKQKEKNNPNRSCIYNLPSPSSPASTPPSSPSAWHMVNKKSRKRSISSERRMSNASNPFALLNLNNNNPSGGKRKTKKQNRR